MEDFRLRISELRDRIKQLHREKIQIQNELDELKNKHSLLLEKNDKLQKEIGHYFSIDKQEQNFTAKFHHLQKEYQRLKSQLESKEIVIPESNYPCASPSVSASAEISKSLMDLKSGLTGQWNQTLIKMNELKNEIVGLKRRINDQQPMPRKLISKLRPQDIRLGLFVDVQNVFYGARKFNAKLDFDRLLTTTINNRRLTRAFAYVVISSEVDQSGFLTMLQHKSFEVKSKNLRLRSDGSAKANWDIEMTIDMLSLADKFDVIALVSGDGDFVPLINILKTIGPLVEVYSFPHNTSKDLMESADRYIAIDKSMLILNEYEPLTTNSLRIYK